MEKINSCYSYIANNWHLVYNPTFQKGIIAGIILLILLILVLKILIHLFKNKDIKCGGVTGKNETGEVFVTAAAISDLVKSLEPDFIGVSIAKTMLFKKGRCYYIRLIAELNDKDVDFPNLVENIRNKIFLAVKSNLGIESIQKIDIHLKRVKG